MKVLRGVFSILILMGFRAMLLAQSTFMPVSAFSNYQLDRLDVLSSEGIAFTGLKPVSREQFHVSIRRNADSLTVSPGRKYLKTELFEYEAPYLEATDQTRAWRGFKNSILTVPSAFYLKRTPDFTLAINPIAGVAAGITLPDNNPNYGATGGLEIRGAIDQKIGFYSVITKNMFRFPEYLNQQIDSTRVIPGEGYHVRNSGKAETFMQGRGYLTFSATRHVRMQFGHDRNFIGNGYRSLILSDFSKEYLFLKINTRVWRFNYQNLFARLSDYNKQSATGKGIQPKFFTHHYLGMRLFKNLEIGVFESVVFDRNDTSGKGTFDPNYLNPVIFYTSVERNLNSGDNVMVGFDWKWNFMKRFSFYGQCILDEYSRKELFNRTGWWANKFGVQSGLKYLNAFGLKGLDLQAEYNLVRPYTYSHFKRSQNYIHYNEPLAHPMGANFRETVFLLRYQPAFRWFVDAGFISSIKGLDSTSKSRHFGGNVLDTYLNRPYEYNHKIGQGVRTQYGIIWLNVSCMLYHNLWLDARLQMRKVDSALSSFNQQGTWLQLGLRWNAQMRMYDY